MDIPTSLDAAQQHVAKIRREKGIDIPNNNASDLEAALIM